MATIKLYINTDRGDISRAFVKSTSEPTTNALPPDLVAGNKRNIEVYLIDSAGNYDARSGASNYALSIGAGPLAGTPSSGTFTLTDGTSTTTAIAFNAGAQAVEDALNALNSGAGPHSQLVDVTSTYDGNYLVKFRTTGAVANLSGDASELSPASAVVIDEAVAGDGSTKEQQYIRLLRQPAIFQDSFTQIANGWSGELSANNARVLELMAGRDTIAIPLDVELTETGNEPETIARGNMLLSNEVINPASIDPANLAQLLTEALGDARYLRTTNNLSDVTDAATARINIGAADATSLTTETNARVDADNRREFAGGVYLDGGYITESISEINLQTNGSRLVKFTTPTAFSGSTEYILGYRVGTTDAKIYLTISGTGVLSYTIGSGEYGSEQLNTNTTYFVQIQWDGTNSELFVNGVSKQTATYSASGSGNPSSKIGSSPTETNKFTGTIYETAIFNIALTATQAAEIYQQGLQPWIAVNPEYRQGQEVYASDFSSGRDGFGSPTGGNVSGNIDNIGGENDVLSFTVDNSSGIHMFFKNVFEIGKTYRIKLKVYNPSSNSLIEYIRLYSGAGESDSGFITLQSDTWQEIDYISPSPHSNPNQRLYILVDVDTIGNNNFTGNGTDVIYIKDIEITQLGSLATLPLNDDCRQLKDISGNRNDATASESGVTHLKQKDLHAFRDDNADGTGGSYLIANADIIAENEVITGVTVDGRFYAASGDQDLTKRRIKLQDHGSHVDVKRSNGTTDDAAIAVTNPIDGTDFAITVLTQRI